MVELLVENMTKEDLEVRDNNDDTALTIAAGIGATRIAECMIQKNKELVSIQGEQDLLPVIVACKNGHKDTAKYLYAITPFVLLLEKNGAHGSLLLRASIFSKMLDISLDLLQKYPQLTTTRNVSHGTTPLIELSSLSDLFPSGLQFVFWKRWIYSIIQVQLAADQHTNVRIPIPQNGDMHRRSILVRAKTFDFFYPFGLKQIYDTKLTHTYALKILHLMSEYISNIDDTRLQQSGVYDAFFIAIKHGIIEVVIEMLKTEPNLLTFVDKNRRGILLSAVQHRQENIFSLTYVLGTRKHKLISGTDGQQNNILHIAAMLAPPHRLARISGAALQMQRELQWYKKVESIVDPSLKEYTNSNNETPGEIFSNEHKELVINGEKWMKETATSCTVVGALIITIMFTAAFTVPGGNVQDTGFPVFLKRKSFMIFIISDAISLFSSSTSALMFLGVLTSRYAEDDFLKSLPTKLIIGLSTLFISIAAMMVAFCATLIIMLKGELKLVIPITLLASIPVTLFMLLQFPLLIEIFVSTYGPSIFDRKIKYWF
ncbi:hypothetical protein P3X46_025274 [Hevea brasiliensis]|uniref:PGG domain-containing protein n=1 Tax=Hevea brasiliensis TaxID=3981 RepID=A0ABQ9L515_HEVBR|nr:hypothetical protein P3X46_025274 [Hevea brasiliensis]